MKRAIAIILLVCFYAVNCQAQGSSKSVKDFGAKGDGVTDDTQALINGVQGSSTLIIPAGTYNIKGVVSFNGLKNKVIIADKNAVIRNTTDDKGSFNFAFCQNLTIQGGTWTYVHLPTSNGKTGQEVYFLFSTCKNVTVNHIHLIGAWEMGICMMACMNMNISNNIIEKCYRDGIYSHYSANLVYCGNHLADIKDDAMSIHDYGIASQRTVLTAAGIPQSGYAIVFDNTTKNTYQGFASIGCTHLFIANNDIQNTVTGGISISNSELLFVGSTARPNNITISNNNLSGVGGNIKIIDDYHHNSAQLSIGRAAIFVGVIDEKDKILNPKSTIKYVTVNDNTVSNSYEDGIYLGNINGLNFFNNVFSNNNLNGDAYGVSAVEMKSCNGVAMGNNTIRDGRKNADGDFIYNLDSVNGNEGQWNISSQMGKQAEASANSSLQKVEERSKEVTVNIGGLSLQPSEFKIIKKPFNPGLLADYINLVAPGGTGGKITANACLDMDNQTVVIIIRNTSQEAIKINNPNWVIREFYHN